MDSPQRKPLPFTQIQIRDAFWAPRQAANREQGLDAVYQQLESTGRLKAYDLDWTPGSDQPEPHVFWDSDVAKWLEGACASLITHPDDALRARVDQVVSRILSAQGKDGYLNPHFTVVEPKARWTNLRDKHELYCAGHLIEAAIAHHRATDEPHFLNGIRHYADLIDHTFGPGEGQRHGYPGHQELELALIKLYRHTGENRYLDLARYFIDERGQPPHFFDIEARQRGEDPADYWAKTHAYTQSHLPVREQQEIVGHAVRGMYLYSAMADLAAELNDPTLVKSLQTLWKDLTNHKLYLTGGIGPSQANEGFTTRYDLPNREAYAETCAAIGLIFWASRMLHLDLDSRYADVMEHALYNGMLSGVSLSGDRFFYENPLASDGCHHRQPFYACSCCPPNLNRLLPVIGEFIYSINKDEIATHLYIQSEAKVEIKEQEITLTQETDYPWDGLVCLTVNSPSPLTFTLLLRHPGWCGEARVYLNGSQIDFQKHLRHGYIALTQEWQQGDEVRIQWAMPVSQVYAHPDVRANTGRVALMRGPLVYCLEAADQTVPVRDIRLPRRATFETRYEPDLLQGVVSIRCQAKTLNRKQWGGMLYRDTPPDLLDIPLKAIPYYVWDNRQPGEMRVWIPEAIF